MKSLGATPITPHLVNNASILPTMPKPGIVKTWGRLDGYKGHLTETCEEDSPHIIVQVETTPVPQPDFEVIPTIQQDLVEKQVLPDDHLMDQGYMIFGMWSQQNEIMVFGSLDTPWAIRVGRPKKHRASICPIFQSTGIRRKSYSAPYATQIAIGMQGRTPKANLSSKLSFLLKTVAHAHNAPIAPITS